MFYETLIINFISPKQCLVGIGHPLSNLTVFISSVMQPSLLACQALNMDWGWELWCVILLLHGVASVSLVSAVLQCHSSTHFCQQ